MFTSAHTHQELSRAREAELMLRAHRAELIRQATTAKAERAAAISEAPASTPRRRLGWLARRPQTA
jgi:hypothetical protein